MRTRALALSLLLDDGALLFFSLRMNHVVRIARRVYERP